MIYKLKLKVEKVKRIYLCKSRKILQSKILFIQTKNLNSYMHVKPN